ncbi:hypothetical protein STEG23_000218, partial [Scotinomys teguina]
IYHFCKETYFIAPMFRNIHSEFNSPYTSLHLHPVASWLDNQMDMDLKSFQ